MSRRSLSYLLGLACVLIGAVAVWRWLPRSIAYYTDDATIRVPTSTVTPRDVLWQPPIRLDDAINTPVAEYEPRLAWDGNTLFFVRRRPGENADIFRCARTPVGWTTPEPFAELNSDYDDLGPEPSLDGRTLYFYSNRPDGHGGFDIWASELGDSGWSAPRNLGPAVNSAYNEYGPAVTPEQTWLYFSSNRPAREEGDRLIADPWRATLRESSAQHDYDIYRARLADGVLEPAFAVGAVNSPYNDGSPAISPVGDFLYFASDRPTGLGGYDLYRARRRDADFDKPVSLGQVVNSTHNELDPALTSAGFVVYFSSDRRSATGATEPREYDIYISSSREVIVETEVLHRAGFDWAGWWPWIWKGLLAALLTLLLAWLLLRLLGDLRSRRLSLLAKCLLASLFLHLLLLLLFTVWGVTTNLAAALNNGGTKHRVALSSEDSAGDVHALNEQIRGQLSEAPPILDAPMIVERPAVQVAAVVPIRSVDVAVDGVDASAELPKFSRPEVQEVPTSDIRADTIRLATSPPVQSAPIDVPIPPTSVAMAVQEAVVESAPMTPVRTHAERPSPALAQSVDSSMRAVLIAPLLLPSEISTNIGHSRLAFDAIVDALPPTPTGLIPVERAPMVNRVDWEGRNPAPTEQAAATVEPSVQFATTPSQPIRRGDIQPPRLDRSARVDVEVARDDTPSSLPQPARFELPMVDRLPQSEFPVPSVELPDPAALERFASPRMPSTEPTKIAEVSRAAEALAELAPALRISLERPNLVALTTPVSSTPMRVDPVTPTEASPPIDPAPSFVPRTLDAALPPPRFAAVDVDHRPNEALGFRLPTEAVAPENPYPQRAVEQRTQFLEEMGGSDETEKAVARALEWLSKHQHRDGHWDGAHFDDGCGRCGGETTYDVSTALTGLSLLCFLGADHTHSKPGPYAESVQRGLTWITRRQQLSGDLRNGETLYSHGIASIALGEAYGMTGDPRLLDPLTRAVRFIQQARNTSVGGWRYDPGQVGDTSVLGWQVMALKSAARAGVEVDPAVLAGADAWLDRVSSKQSPGLYSYQPGRGPTPTMTAEGMLVRELLGHSRNDPMMRASARHVLANLPDWDEKPNTYYWYYATLALFQYQGDEWRQWNESVTAQLLPNQRMRGPAAGSWDPIGEWADVGGRVYQTALCTLMLEVYYRYLPLYSLQEATTNLSTADPPSVPLRSAGG